MRELIERMKRKTVPKHIPSPPPLEKRALETNVMLAVENSLEDGVAHEIASKILEALDKQGYEFYESDLRVLKDKIATGIESSSKVVQASVVKFISGLGSDYWSSD